MKLGTLFVRLVRMRRRVFLWNTLSFLLCFSFDYCMKLLYSEIYASYLKKQWVWFVFEKCNSYQCSRWCRVREAMLQTFYLVLQRYTISLVKGFFGYKRNLFVCNYNYVTFSERGRKLAAISIVNHVKCMAL